MATRSAFNDDSYQMFRMDNVLDSVNLNVIGWNRATVADGQWLQDNAIGPLSARDMYLADCIDEAWGSINNIRQTLADMGAETTGVNLVGFTMKSLNVAQCNDPDAAYTDNNLGWKTKHTSLVTSGAGDTFMTPASLSYLSIGNQAEDLGAVAQTLAAGQYGGILQVNTTAKDAYQMAFTPGGIYYRHISPSDGTAQTQAGDKGDFTYMDNPPAFSALPLGAMNEEQINAKLAGYLTKADASTTYVSASTYNTYTANHISADNAWDAKFNDYVLTTTYQSDKETFLTGVNATGLLAGKGTTNDALRFVVPQNNGDFVLHCDNGNELSWSPLPSYMTTVSADGHGLTGTGLPNDPIKLYFGGTAGGGKQMWVPTTDADGDPSWTHEYTVSATSYGGQPIANPALTAGSQAISGLVQNMIDVINQLWEQVMILKAFPQ